MRAATAAGPTPTRWRCECGATHTPTSRCDRLAPWESHDARLDAECATLTANYYDQGRPATKAYWLVRREERARQRRAGPIPTDVHGRATGYQYWRCRCLRCRTWNATDQRARRAGGIRILPLIGE